MLEVALGILKSFEDIFEKNLPKKTHHLSVLSEM